MNEIEEKRQERVRTIFNSIEDIVKEYKNGSWKDLNEYELINKIQKLSSDFVRIEKERQKKEAKEEKKRKTKQLKPEEFSEDRKKAEAEIQEKEKQKIPEPEAAPEKPQEVINENTEVPGNEEPKEEGV